MTLTKQQIKDYENYLRDVLKLHQGGIYFVMGMEIDLKGKLSKDITYYQNYLEYLKTTKK